MRTKPVTSDVLALLQELLVPLASVARTIKVPFDLRRWENDAEHSYFLATLGCALGSQIDSSLDLGKISQYALVHDLVEVYAGDTTVWAPQAHLDSKPQREEAALRRIEQRFGAVFPWVSKTITTYERLDQPESCFVYALDKLLPYAIMMIADHQPLLRTRAACQEKERLARSKVARYPLLLSFFDDLCRLYASRRHFFVRELSAVQ